MNEQNTGIISDGYHTFDELYEHRYALFIALMRSHPRLSWRAKYHEDGTMYEDCFIAGMHLTTGDISYHLPVEKFILLDGYNIETSLLAPKWDGHKSDDVIKRLYDWIVPKT